MAPASGVLRWKDLCIDALDPRVVGRFWEIGLDLVPEVLADGDLLLRGKSATEDVWINTVGMHGLGPQRVSLTLSGTEPIVAELVDSGGEIVGQVVDGEESLWTIRDPEGGTLYVSAPEGFERRIRALSVDAIDPDAMAQWWARAFGVDGAPSFLFVFTPTAESKSVKNRIHWDVTGLLDDVLAHGATLVRGHDDEITWDICADPEGNEFCVFAPKGLA